MMSEQGVRAPLRNWWSGQIIVSPHFSEQSCVVYKYTVGPTGELSDTPVVFQLTWEREVERNVFPNMFPSSGRHVQSSLETHAA